MYFVNLYTITKVNNNEFTQKTYYYRVLLIERSGFIYYITSLVMDYFKKSTLL